MTEKDLEALQTFPAHHAWLDDFTKDGVFPVVIVGLKPTRKDGQMKVAFSCPVSLPRETVMQVVSLLQQSLRQQTYRKRGPGGRT